jgi:hypothetical protein
MYLLEYIIQSSKHLSVEYCFCFSILVFVFILSSEKPRNKKNRQRNKQWCSEGVAA